MIAGGIFWASLQISSSTEMYLTIHQRRALQLALHALERDKKRIAVDANLYEQAGADYPAAVRAYTEKRRIIEAQKVIREMLEDE
jgi:hypothetical protein